MGLLIASIVIFCIVLIGVIIWRWAVSPKQPSTKITDYLDRWGTPTEEDKERAVEARESAQKEWKTNKRKHIVKSIPCLLIPFVSFLLLLFGSFCTVGANEVGIIYHDKKGVVEEVKYEGFQAKSIFEHITKISTTNRNTQITVAGQTSDSAYANFIITIVYKIDSVDAGKFYKQTSARDIGTEQMASMVKEALQSSTIQYDIYSILGDKLEEVRIDFTENLKKIMYDRYYITVVSTSFDDIDAGTRIEEIIKNKAEALQQIEIAQAEQQKAEVEKQTALIRAEAEAEAKRIAAEAAAEILRIEAEAQADAVKLEQEAIGKAILAYVDTLGLTEQEAVELYEYLMWIAQWDGDVPMVDGSGNTNVVIPMP